MSVPDKNFTKCTLLVQRSSQAFIDYHTMLFSSHFIHQAKQARERKRERESRYDYESTMFCQAFLYERKKNISSLYKIICSLVSPFHIL